jgi:SAM-dependent methyltransferase
MSKDRKRLLDYYEHEGEALDHQPEILKDIFHVKLMRKIWNLCPKEFGSFADIGCAEGAYVGQAATIARIACGLDISTPKLRRALERVAIMHTGKAFFLKADAEAIPWQDNTFEVVFCCETLEHVWDPAKALTECVRICSRWLIVSVPGELTMYRNNRNPSDYDYELGSPGRGHIHSFKVGELVNLIAGLGLKVREVRGTVFHWPYRYRVETKFSVSQRLYDWLDDWLWPSACIARFSEHTVVLAEKRY